MTDKERTNLGHELSDVLIYLIRLSQLCHVDLPAVVMEKFKHNAAKYPAEKVRGSSKKYNEYEEVDGAAGSAPPSINTQR